MAVLLSTPLPRFARDLPTNPARCEVGDPTCPPATMVLEALVSDVVSDTGRMHWLTCDRIACLSEAQQLADGYAAVDTDLRDATVAELLELSGLDVTGAEAAA